MFLYLQVKNILLKWVNFPTECESSKILISTMTDNISTLLPSLSQSSQSSQAYSEFQQLNYVQLDTSNKNQ